MEEGFFMIAAKSAAAGVAKLVGYNSAEDRAALQLASIASAFTRQLGIYALEHANDEGRSEVNADDIADALLEVGSSPEKLTDFIFYPRSFPKPAARRLLRLPEPPLMLALDAIRSNRDASSIYPGYLPPFPTSTDEDVKEPTQGESCASRGLDGVESIEDIGTRHEGAESAPHLRGPSDNSLDSPTSASATKPERKGHDGSSDGRSDGEDDIAGDPSSASQGLNFKALPASKKGTAGITVNTSADGEGSVGSNYSDNTAGEDALAQDLLNEDHEGDGDKFHHSNTDDDADDDDEQEIVHAEQQPEGHSAKVDDGEREFNPSLSSKDQGDEGAGNGREPDDVDDVRGVEDEDEDEDEEDGDNEEDDEELFNVPFVDPVESAQFIVAPMFKEVDAHEAAPVKRKLTVSGRTLSSSPGAPSLKVKVPKKKPSSAAKEQVLSERTRPLPSRAKPSSTTGESPRNATSSSSSPTKSLVPSKAGGKSQKRSASPASANRKKHAKSSSVRPSKSQDVPKDATSGKSERRSHKVEETLTPPATPRVTIKLRAPSLSNNASTTTKTPPPSSCSSVKDSSKPVSGSTQPPPSSAPAKLPDKISPPATAVAVLPKTSSKSASVTVSNEAAKEKMSLPADDAHTPRVMPAIVKTEAPSSPKEEEKEEKGKEKDVGKTAAAYSHKPTTPALPLSAAAREVKVGQNKAKSPIAPSPRKEDRPRQPAPGQGPTGAKKVSSPSRVSTLKTEDNSKQKSRKDSSKGELPRKKAKTAVRPSSGSSTPKKSLAADPEKVNKRPSTSSTTSSTSTSCAGKGSAGRSLPKQPYIFPSISEAEYPQAIRSIRTKGVEITNREGEMEAGPPYCVCKSDKEDDNYMQCSQCLQWYHPHCVGADSLFFSPVWICSACDEKFPYHKRNALAIIEYLKRWTLTPVEGFAHVGKTTAETVFGYPVDVPGYRDVIKRPMDLSTLAKRVRAGKYSTMGAFYADAALIVLNCRQFNAENPLYYAYGDQIGIAMEMLWKVLAYRTEQQQRA